MRKLYETSAIGELRILFFAKIPCAFREPTGVPIVRKSLDYRGRRVVRILDGEQFDRALDAAVRRADRAKAGRA